MAAQKDARFVPLIAEVFGALHGDLLRFIKRLARIAHYDDTCGWSRLEVIAGMKGAIGVAIQKGNVHTLDRVQLMNRLAGLVPSEARRAAQAQRDAQREAPGRALRDAQAPAVLVHALAPPAAAAAGEFGDFFGADGPAFFPDQGAIVRVPGFVAAEDYEADDDSDDPDCILLEGAEAQEAARRRQAL